MDTSLHITALPAFSDNYIWVLSAGNCCAVVDPGDPHVVMEYLSQTGHSLNTILITHHHYDHVDGLPELIRHHSPIVFGPADPRIQGITRHCSQGDTVNLDAMGLSFQVLETPGHTSSHIAYYGHNSLFCGDTLFSAGCGRLFEGTAEQMQTSLDKLAELPDTTRVYCTHEYTQSNCDFALAVEPDNQELLNYTLEVKEKRQADAPTLPSHIGLEKAINPFMRSRRQTVVNAARMRQSSVSPGAETLAVIRDWKDHF